MLNEVQVEAIFQQYLDGLITEGEAKSKLEAEGLPIPPIVSLIDCIDAWNQ